MRLGLSLGYWGAGNDGDNLALAREADRLGYAVVWASEAYGSDAATVLSWVAAQTERVDVGSAVFQIPARTPAMAAMTAATLDTLSEGRFRLGIGVSGPLVSEGWHGVRFDAPLERTREYVDILRMTLAREKVAYTGKHYLLPLPDGPGKALKLTVHPVRERIPIYLAAVGPKNLELCGEIADGWLSLFTSAMHLDDSLKELRAGRARRPDGGDSLVGFDIVANCAVSIGDDLEEAAARLRPQAALYVGGMGSRERNFYNAYARRLGFDNEARKVQDLYLAKDYSGAMAAVPYRFLDETALLGPVGRIADRLQAYAEAGVTTMTIAPTGTSIEERMAAVRGVAEAFERGGLG
jgi:F420-dependent oxidoreductase-like protein